MQSLTVKKIGDYLLSRAKKDPGPTLTRLARMVAEYEALDDPEPVKEPEPAKADAPTKKKGYLRSKKKEV